MERCIELKLGIQARYGSFSNRLDFGVNRCIADLCRGQRSHFQKSLCFQKMAQDRSDFCMLTYEDAQDLLNFGIQIDLENKVKVK